MNKETYERVMGLVCAIAYGEQCVSVIETMLDRFDNSMNSSISVNCVDGPRDGGVGINHTQLPELREALQKGLERFRNEVIENQAKLEAL
jgi:ribosomal protein S5